MRTTSSFKFVGVFAPPRNWPMPLTGVVVGPGKMPALSSAAAFGSIMQEGILFPGNGDPCTIPTGAVPPGQFRNNTVLLTCAADGTLIAVETELKFPP